MHRERMGGAMLQSYAVPNTSMDEIETYLKPY